MEKWKPQAGDHVYHVCEFELDSCEMRKKGMEGFKRWGYEVVESVIVDKYIWRSKSGSTTSGWASELIRRDVGKVTEKTRCSTGKQMILVQSRFARCQKPRSWQRDA